MVAIDQTQERDVVNMVAIAQICVRDIINMVAIIWTQEKDVTILTSKRLLFSSLTKTCKILNGYTPNYTGKNYDTKNFLHYVTCARLLGLTKTFTQK